MKSLFLHIVGDESYRVFVEDDSFNKETASLERILESEGSCWIPVEADLPGVDSENHIFLTAEMKKRCYLRTYVSND